MEECLLRPACQHPDIAMQIQMGKELMLAEAHADFVAEAPADQAALAGDSWDSCNEV